LLEKKLAEMEVSRVYRTPLVERTGLPLPSHPNPHSNSLTLTLTPTLTLALALTLTLTLLLPLKYCAQLCFVAVQAKLKVKKNDSNEATDLLQKKLAEMEASQVHKTQHHHTTHTTYKTHERTVSQSQRQTIARQAQSHDERAEMARARKTDRHIHLLPWTRVTWAFSCVEKKAKLKGKKDAGKELKRQEAAKKKLDMQVLRLALVLDWAPLAPPCPCLLASLSLPHASCLMPHTIPP
jgi:hypothetical protein